jgi:hypothetical protein
MLAAMTARVTRTVRVLCTVSATVAMVAVAAGGSEDAARCPAPSGLPEAGARSAGGVTERARTGTWPHSPTAQARTWQPR